MVGGELCPIEGKANPLLATPAFAAAAERAGARIVRNADVTAIERTRAGFELTTSRGRFRAPRLVLCAGAATAPLARMLGIELPIEGHPMQVNVTEAVAPLVPHLVYFAGDRLTLKQARIGSLLIGGGWPAAVHPRSGRLTVDLHGVRRNLAVARRVVPPWARRGCCGRGSASTTAFPTRPRSSPRSTRSRRASSSARSPISASPPGRSWASC